MNLDLNPILTLVLLAAAIVAIYDCIKGKEYGVFGKTLWVMFIVLVPLFGIFFYCLFSRRKNKKRVREKYNQLKKNNEGKSS